MVGSGGAGKSTFARALGERTGLPVVHLDAHFWRPGWAEPPRDEWRAQQAELVAADEWIMDGNYGGTFDLRFAAADTIVVMALSRWRCVAAVVRRVVRDHGRETQAPGCPERFDLAFLRWVWRYPIDARRRLDAALERVDGAEVVELTTRGAVRRFLAGVSGD